MTLTVEQKQALEQGQPVSIRLDGTECVVVRRDVFDRLTLVEYDDSEWSDDEMRAVAARTFEQAEEAEPIP